MIAQTSRPASFRRPPPLWFVSNGELTVGPVRTDLLQRGVWFQRIPEDCWVRELTWRTWRRLDEIREVRSVLRSLAGAMEPEAGAEQLVKKLGRASDAAEVLTLALLESCERTRADFGLVHRPFPGKALPITTTVHGLTMLGRLGRPLLSDDPTTSLARVGGVVVGPPAAGRVERAIATRFGAPPDLAGVAMVPVTSGRHLLAIIELGRLAHSFRSSDAETLSQVARAAVTAIRSLRAY